MIGPVAIYLAVNAGHPSARGWGVAMSTDTAFALGALALVGRRLPDRVRTYLLTFSVVDDLAGIVVIAVVYSGHVRSPPTTGCSRSSTPGAVTSSFRCSPWPTPGW